MTTRTYRSSAMRTCKQCGVEKSVEGFYAGASKCKVCVCAAVKAHRLANLSAIREYDRVRSKLPHRIASATRVSREWRRKFRDRLSAHNAAARAGLVAPPRCEGCGLEKRLEKHH